MTTAIRSSIVLAVCMALAVCCDAGQKQKSTVPSEEKVIIFLHNKYLELFTEDVPHEEYGTCEYTAIKTGFLTSGFTVLSEIRPNNTDVRAYARKVIGQIDSLLKVGVKSKHITVIGTSKGGYIAKDVSALLGNPEVNYVLIGCCNAEDNRMALSGNVLSIYERTDSIGVSCQPYREMKNAMTRYKEIELNTGLRHGFLYKASDTWMMPAIEWASGE